MRGPLPLPFLGLQQAKGVHRSPGPAQGQHRGLLEDGVGAECGGDCDDHQPGGEGTGEFLL